MADGKECGGGDAHDFGARGSCCGNEFDDAKQFAKEQLEEAYIRAAKEAGRADKIAENLRGIVKWYNSRLCYGFIEREGNGRELFVHRNSIVMMPGELTFLRPYTPVLFDLWTLPDGRLEAQNVRSSTGKPISLRYGPRPMRSCSHDGYAEEPIDFYQNYGGHGSCCIPAYCLCCSRRLEYPQRGGRMRSSISPERKDFRPLVS
ncbi:Y-box-binding protein 2-A [Galendromus occidentalis]|uniref:Y-box-binding protein 2-A n=1 Tax=Galendromus occidentalis TaxID=34638 RepID=A0AAJ7SFA1_9ACAR|nr:Y-box-binding protein 2-A [Galendromus occidentalis]